MTVSKADPTLAERSRRHHARQTGKLPPVCRCSGCGASTYRPRDGLCRKCWLKTPAGKADTLRRTKATRERKKRAQQQAVMDTMRRLGGW